MRGVPGLRSRRNGLTRGRWREAGPRTANAGLRGKRSAEKGKCSCRPGHYSWCDPQARLWHDVSMGDQTDNMESETMWWTVLEVGASVLGVILAAAAAPTMAQARAQADAAVTSALIKLTLTCIGLMLLWKMIE